MKCAKCVEEGERSIVYPDMVSTTTDMMWQPYYDEDGTYHSHDPNGHSRGYRCSRRHRWSVGSNSACPAGDYSANETIRWWPDAPKPEPVTVYSQDANGEWGSRVVSGD